MQAFEIRYAPEGERVALGWRGGLLAVHAVDPADGSPGAEIAEIAHHKATLLRVGWVDDTTLVSVDEAGAWAVSDAATGAVHRSGVIEGEYLTADVSPSGTALFVYAYAGRQARLWRVSVHDGEVTEAPPIDESVSVVGRVFALEDELAMVRFVRRSGPKAYDEGFVYVDFAAGTVTEKIFDLGPRSDFDEGSRLLAIDAARGIGVRPDYEPVELMGDAESGLVVLRAELFDARSLERLDRKVVMGWPRSLLDGPYAALESHEPGSPEFAEAQDWLVRKLTSAAFVPDSPHLWLGLAVGAVRRIAIDGDARDVPVFHGGGADTGPPGLDDLFARSLSNLQTLGVSADGRYVGFGNPNTFFSVPAIGLETASEPIRLPARRAQTPETEMPGLVRFAGDRLYVFDRGDHLHVADGETGEPLRRQELGEYYGEATDLARSADGRWLVMAVSGGSSLCWDAENDALMELPVPPHGIRAEFIAPHRVALVHHGGAVVVVDFEAEDHQALRAPDDTGDDPDEDWDAFEQRYDLYGAACYTVGGAPHVATVDEHDALQTYALAEGIEVGPTFDRPGSRMAGGADWLAVTTGSEVAVLAMPSGEVRASHAFGRATALHAGDETGTLHAFDDESGELVALDGDERSVRFVYWGAATAAVHFSERLGRVVVVTAAGLIELYDLQSGDRVATLRVRVGEEERTLERD